MYSVCVCIVCTVCVCDCPNLLCVQVSMHTLFRVDPVNNTKQASLTVADLRVITSSYYDLETATSVVRVTIYYTILYYTILYCTLYTILYYTVHYILYYTILSPLGAISYLILCYNDWSIG